jgi:SAM-dependent methyltransferase
MAYQDMKFEGDYLLKEWTKVKPRLEAGESIETIHPIKVYRHRQVAREIANRVGAGATVLEIGCGASFALHELSKLGLRCHGVDMDPTVIEYSQALKKSYGSNVEFSQLDAFSLPFPDKSFDVVFSVGVLEHYSPEDQLLLAKECKRLAKRFVEIHIPNESPDSCIHFLIKDHEDSHLPTDLVKLSQDAGLREIELEGRGVFVSSSGCEKNSPTYQDFIRRRFPELWKDLGANDIELLIASEQNATKEERMKFGSIHYVVAKA